MSNNNNTRNIYNKSVNGANDEEMEFLLNSANVPHEIMENKQMTTINIENDMTPGTSQQFLQRQQRFQQTRREVSATRINMDTNSLDQQAANGDDSINNEDRQRLPSLFAMWREARHQFVRSQSLRDPYPPPSGENNSANTHIRTWRENLYEVLSSPASLRAIFNSSANVRQESSHTNITFPDDQIYFAVNHQNNQGQEELQTSSINHHSNGLETQSSSTLRLSRQSSRITDERSLSDNSVIEPETPLAHSSTDNAIAATNNTRTETIAINSTANGGRQPQRQSSVAGSTTAPTVDMIDDADANAVGEFIVKFVTHFIRYLPFIFIIFVKFIHDNLLGILDILILHSVVYHINKSVKDQVAKLNQKSYVILVRDVIMATFAVSYRFLLCTTAPDPFGLLINPPGAPATLDLFTSPKVESTKFVSLNVPFDPFANVDTTNSLNSSISITKGVTLGSLVYYVAINDLVLKLLTQVIKITVTMFPTKIIRHKSRARFYALIEIISQFYRALVPIRQYLKYLCESYTGLEVISGILFSSFYMGAKLFELFERGRPLKKTFVNFMRNMDYDRKPTKDELEAAGTVCPICHDNFSSPVILECSHIFCDECVSTWFKREQTCPMCRAKVSEDPTWQDGATTFFYQLF